MNSLLKYWHKPYTEARKPAAKASRGASTGVDGQAVGPRRAISHKSSAPPSKSEALSTLICVMYGLRVKFVKKISGQRKKQPTRRAFRAAEVCRMVRVPSYKN